MGQFICVDWRPAPSFGFGITASGRYGNAPERSRFKRLVREAVRFASPHLSQTLEIHVLPRQRTKMAKMGQIRDEILQLLC